MIERPFAGIPLVRLAISGFALVLMVTPVFYSGAQTKPPDSLPIQNVGPIDFARLPLSPETRRALQQSVASRDYTEAEELLVKEAGQQPHSYVLLASLGRIFFLDGKYLNCAIAMKKADRAAPLQASDRYTLALAYVVLKKSDWARAEFDKLAQSDPRNPNYIYWQGRSDYDSMRLRAAVSEYQRVLALDPNYMKAYDNLGLTDEALGDLDAAIKNYHQATELNRAQQAPSPWPPLNLGALLIKLGKFDEAERSLRESLRYDGRFPTAHYELGRLLEKEKKDDEALQELRLAALYDPEYPEPHYAMGQIYQRTGKKDQAASEWKTFQKLKQEHPHARTH